MARFRSQRQTTRRTPPNRAWTGFQSSSFAAIAAGTKVLLGSFSITNPGIDETVLRVVGGLSIVSDTVAGSEEQIGAAGMIIVTDRAVAAGIGSIPDPVTDLADDWFWFQSFAAKNLNGDATGFQAPASVWYPFDQKAKRVFDGDGRNIAIVVANAHATHAFDIALQFRILAMVRGT